MQFVIKVDEEEECVPVVRQRIGGARVVRINGHSGVGKSRIGKALAADLGWHLVKVDDFLDREPLGRRRFPEKVKLAELRNDIENHLGGIVLEGIWIDHLVPPDTYGTEFKIYMRACFAPEFDMDEARRRKKLGTNAYHQEYQPERWADLVVMKVAILSFADDF